MVFNCTGNIMVVDNSSSGHMSDSVVANQSYSSVIFDAIVVV